jgi:hypothetical protein
MLAYAVFFQLSADQKTVACDGSPARLSVSTAIVKRAVDSVQHLPLFKNRARESLMNAARSWFVQFFTRDRCAADAYRHHHWHVELPEQDWEDLRDAIVQLVWYDAMQNRRKFTNFKHMMTWFQQTIDAEGDTSVNALACMMWQEKLHSIRETAKVSSLDDLLPMLAEKFKCARLAHVCDDMQPKFFMQLYRCFCHKYVIGMPKMLL